MKISTVVHSHYNYLEQSSVIQKVDKLTEWVSRMAITEKKSDTELGTQERELPIMDDKYSLG